MTAITPVSEQDRALSLDVLRGVAVLGILAMNIRGFAMPQAAYVNPTVYGGLSDINQLWFWLTALFADQKFMTLFSMMFGAGIALMSERTLARGAPDRGLLLRRNGWLLLLGLVHAYLIWYGDILVMYSLTAFVVMACRNWRPRLQLIIGVLLLAIPSLIFFAAGTSFEYWPKEDVQLSLKDWAPGTEAIASELAAYRGSWVEQMPFRVESALEFHTVGFLIFAFWRIGGLMLIGMALYRGGWLTGDRSIAAYRKLAAVGLLALPLIAWGLFRNEQGGWAFRDSMFVNSQFNYWGSVGLSLAYLGLVMLWCLGDRLAGLRTRFAAVGRTAFSCYIAQSLICTLLFYGHGLGQFGYFEHWQQALVVFAVWALLLFAAPWWLARYRFGPMEWLWRSLTYWQRQPLRR